MSGPFWLGTYRQNMLGSSEEMDDATQWNYAQVSVSGNAAVAPDGQTTADKIVEDGSTHFHNLRHNNMEVGSGAAVTGSIFLKAEERTWARLVVRGAGSINGGFAYFDLANGRVGETSGGVDAVSIHPIGGGWYRTALSTTFPSSNTVAFVTVGLATANGVSSYAGDGSSGLYVWGGQLERESTVGPYIATSETSVFSNTRDVLAVAPDFDYIPGAVKEMDVHRTKGGGRYEYRWGEYKRFSIPVSWVTNSFQSQTDSWWGAGTELLWTDNHGVTVSSVRLTNEERPIARVEAPYLDQFGGDLELETY